MTRTIWTFEPDEITQSLVSKAIVAKVGRAALAKNPNAGRGLRTKLLNASIRLHLAEFTGKREASNGKG